MTNFEVNPDISEARTLSTDFYLLPEHFKKATLKVNPQLVKRSTDCGDIILAKCSALDQLKHGLRKV